MSSILGRSIAFPPRIGSDGRLAWSDGEPNVRESIRIILQTSPGERIMRPSFGCGLRELLFEPNTVSTRRILEDRVRVALQRWEPRIRLQSVAADADPDDPRAAIIRIVYRLIATGVTESTSLTVQFEQS
jgi:hypothetical protein